MAKQQLIAKEQLVKRVVPSGNGGAVWVPKSWLGEEVVVILPDKPKQGINERVFRVLEPHLKNILSISIYGSYARNEATEDSDIDVLAITTNKQFTLTIPEENMEILALPLEKMKEAIQKYPTQYYQIIHEAQPLLNALLLEELQKVPLQKKRFLAYLKETKEHIQSNKEFIELDALDGTFLNSFSVLYSLLLRLRGIFIAQCLLEAVPFSNKQFKIWFCKKGFTEKEFDMCYAVYRRIRDNKSIEKIKIKLSTAEKIVHLLEDEIKELERKI